MNKNSMGLLGLVVLVASMCYAADDKRHFIVQINGYKNTSGLVEFLHTQYCLPGGLYSFNCFEITRCLTRYKQEKIDNFQHRPMKNFIEPDRTPSPFDFEKEFPLDSD